MTCTLDANDCNYDGDDWDLEYLTREAIKSKAKWPQIERIFENAYWVITYNYKKQVYSFGEHCNQVEQEGRESTINELDDHDDDTIHNLQ